MGYDQELYHLARYTNKSIVMEVSISQLVGSAVLFAIVTAVRLYWMLVRALRQEESKRTQNASHSERDTTVVLGSGGHTTEMLRLLDATDPTKYRPKTFVIAQTDNFSLEKLTGSHEDQAYQVIRIPRSREVKQSWPSSVWTTGVALLFTLGLWKRLNRTDLLLVNGPGTCVPLCLVAWIINKLKRLTRISSHATKIVFVESIARVKTLSLTGKILVHFADHVLVQWPELALKHPTVKYIDRFT